MIKIENLTYYYPNATTPALDNINLEIRDGEFILLVGPSGCGKS
jgi:multiple sugar transport system ATP-binding protein